ncbi:PPR_2 domain-containing protein/PPR_3 domain-containing protein, partial [Cephalotus follicularis]
PDTAAFNAVLNACANLGDTKKFLQLFEEMPEFGSEPDVLTYNVMIKLCAKDDRKDLLVFVLERIIEKEIPLCMTTLHSLVAAYVGFGDIGTAEKLVQAMREGRRDLCKILRDHPDHVTYTTVVSALVKAGSMDRARQVLAEMTRIGVPANRITYNILLKGYCQQLQIDKARQLLKEMADDAGIEPDVVSYNILIDGCILVDDSAGALVFFNEMRAKGIAPTKISYTTLMKAFALSGQPKLANKVFDEMLRDPRVKVDMIAWNMLVEGYCRLGFVEDAKKIVQKMKENGFYPNVSTYGSLANGIALARKPGEALLLWKEVKERC